MRTVSSNALSFSLLQEGYNQNYKRGAGQGSIQRDVSRRQCPGHEVLIGPVFDCPNSPLPLGPNISMFAETSGTYNGIVVDLFTWLYFSWVGQVEGSGPRWGVG